MIFKRFHLKAMLSAALMILFSVNIYSSALQHSLLEYKDGGHCKEQKPAKYVFLFIGDGMGFAHVALTEAYLATKKGKIGSEPLLFTQFPVLGMATTYSYSNMITCSSASATALASGFKTRNGMVGMYPDSTNVTQITYKLKDQGYKIGIMTSVTIDHATPSGFFGHNVSRKNYFQLAMELPTSGFDFFGGGGFQGVKDKKEKDAEKRIYDNLASYGYTVAYGLEEYNRKKSGTDKMVLFQADKSKKDEILPFVIGRKSTDLTLAQVLRSAIDFIYKPNDKGFFMMCEGGKIDWGAHNNDVASTIFETLDMDEAIAVAYEFYKQHPDETLIVVTADHETGGLALGRKSGYTFDLSGIDASIKKVDSQELTVENYMEKEILDTISKAAKIGWTTSSHTGIYVPVFAVGAGSNLFAGRINNTDIPLNILKAMNAVPYYSEHYYKRRESFKSEAPISGNDIVFLGNSLTESGKWEEYFSSVNAKLKKNGGAIRNRGINGDTFEGIDNRLSTILEGQPKTIFLLTGANDVSHNLSADSIANGIMNVVKRIKRESPKTKIYLQSLLPINESFGRYKLLTGKTAEISKINGLLAQMAKEEQVTFLDIYPLFLDGGKVALKKPANEQVMNPAITNDGLHLKENGYKIWADAIRKYVK